jgi:hypothetical protein
MGTGGLCEQAETGHALKKLRELLEPLQAALNGMVPVALRQRICKTDHGSQRWFFIF